MNIYELKERARTDGRSSHDLREHCANNFMRALAELKRLADSQAQFTEEQLTDMARVDLSLIAELEEVK